MNRWTSLCLAALLAAGSLLAGEAADKATPATRARIESALTKRVTLDFADTPVGDVARYLADFSGVNIIVDHEPGTIEPAQVTFKCHDMSLSLAMKFLLKQVGLRYRAEASAIYVATSERMKEVDRQEKSLSLETPDTKAALTKPVTLDFGQTPMQDVMTFLSDFTGLNFVLDARGEHSVVRFKVSDMPLQDALIYMARRTKLRVYAVQNAIVFTDDPTSGAE